ncbi:hypothetical protein TrCOL_g6088 [Triparma columacea]|uniref:WH2 domain-containing protein n=1 Tax=Triparma columacea TaxID=722753 RepID=A0A9W7FZ79_9STRA|nr:hypothetical protein TrCOL_g6088 [Triparma columacea]
MPLVKRSLAHPLEYAEPTIYQSSPNNLVLQNVNEASMCGVMTQLGYLASYATEIFQDLCELADTTHKRVVICTERTRNVLEEIPKVQLALSQGDSSFSEMLQGKQDLVVEQEVVQQLFVATSLPAAIDARYRGGEVKEPPDFSPVEAAMTPEEHTKHGNCAKVYSDPHFFFSEWQKQEEVRFKEQMEIKAQKKAEKKARRAKEKELKQRERGLQKTVTAKKQLNWRNRYNQDDVGGAVVVGGGGGGGGGMQGLVTVSEVADARLETVDKQRGVMAAMRGAGGGAEGVGGGGGAPPPVPKRAAPPAPVPAAAAGGSFRPPPPPKPAGSKATGGQPPPPPKKAPPAPPVQGHQEYVEPEEYVHPVVQQQSRPAPPPKREMQKKEIMPKSALNMNVLAGIKGGAKLRKAEPIVKKVDPKMNLLASIKKKGAKGGLKKVDVEKIQKERRASGLAAGGGGGGGGMFGGGGGINAILERRKFLAEESDDSDTDDDDDWD